MDSIEESSDSQLCCITLDLENDWYFDQNGYDHLTFDFLDQYIELINNLNIPVSVFVVGKTLERFPRKIEMIQSNVDAEFHLHSYNHDLSKSYDFLDEINNGISVFESHFGYQPRGYRAPQGNINSTEIQQLDEMGFEFDSSIFPSYRPGVYSNLDVPLSPYRPEGSERLVEYPIGALPKIRVPLSQSYLKLFGRPYLWVLKRIALPEILIFDSHLQDFYQTASHNQLDVPLRQIHQRNLGVSVELFQSLTRILRGKGYKFVKMSDIHDRIDYR
jgi:peptidoglycan/xylan/chitin deacetylase (PgdA/CDA1 family)